MALPWLSLNWNVVLSIMKKASNSTFQTNEILSRPSLPQHSSQLPQMTVWSSVMELLAHRWSFGVSGSVTPTNWVMCWQNRNPIICSSARRISCSSSATVYWTTVASRRCCVPIRYMPSRQQRLVCRWRKVVLYGTHKVLVRALQWLLWHLISVVILKIHVLLSSPIARNLTCSWQELL